MNPYHQVDAYLSGIYVGIDDLELVLESRQQHPHT